VDFVNNDLLKNAIETLYYEKKKVIAADCHGVIALPQCNNKDAPMVKGLHVTGFTNTEEDAVQLTSKVPFLIESKLKEQGAIFERAEDWHPQVSVDGTLITGQNPQSSEACANAVLQLLLA